ncbi:M1 family metallopeptidase [Streptomyces sp. URMC 123]|uniref:M1 family metallopeptidase n=1 Tax=Streptomyces sp. URMC 123 TaxID=3423403 RepID=UPI003F1931AC
MRSTVKLRAWADAGRGGAFAAVLLLSAVACTGEGGATPGAPGVGDALFPRLGNGGYDVGHYQLDLDYDVSGGRLSATAVVTATATQSLSSFHLDLAGLRVDSVTVDGKAAEARRKGSELIVDPAEPIERGRTFRTTVVYGGQPERLTDPDGSAEGWVRTDDGAFVVGEPAGSMTWFPGNNHPSDKAAYDISITVPEGYTAVAGGELREERTAGGRTTFVWHSAEPMASYLATATIGRFEVSRATTASGLPLYFAVDPREAEASKEALSRTEEILDWASKLFGPYPFSSAGAIVGHEPQDVGYALETQTKPVYPSAPDVETVLHELTHQWFGNSVTPRSWRDMWLNEGFATYAEWLWSEQHGGGSAQERFDELYATPEDGDLWEFPPADPGRPENVSGDPVYERGAMVLHQLRLAVGDSAFFDILKGWTAAHRHGNADTDDFVTFCSDRTDKDLKKLFDTWLYGEGRPDWTYEPAADS